MHIPPSQWIKLKFENLTTARAPLLKIYYWEHFDIDNLNAKLDRNEAVIEHLMRLPAAQMNSHPLKVVFWLRNSSRDRAMHLQLKRVQNCMCQPIETRVGCNQFRKLFKCPHRNLVHIKEQCVEVKPTELVAFSVVFNYLMYGEYTLTYQMCISDCRVVNLNFHLDITGFDLCNCLLNRQLLPVNVRDIHRFVQPLWVNNISKQYRNFGFTSKEWAFELLNPNMVVPCHSVWPLMVKYQPSEMTNEFDLAVHYDNVSTCIRLQCHGTMRPTAISDEPLSVPLLDYHSVDYPFIAYPNRLEMSLEQNEERTCLLAIHNFHPKCMAFQWQNYIIKDLFEITFEPLGFRLKPNHTTMCVATIRSFECPLHFNRVPLVLEVHRVDTRATRIAKSFTEGDEIDSLDNPNWYRGTYMEHIFVQLNVRVNFKKDKVVVVDSLLEMAISHNAAMLSAREGISIFEKLFWEYLQMTAFTEDSIGDDLTCEQVLALHRIQPSADTTAVEECHKTRVMKIMVEWMAEKLLCLAKGSRFIRKDYDAPM